MKIRSPLLTGLVCSSLFGTLAQAVVLPIDKSQWQLPHFNTSVTTPPDGPGGQKCFKFVTKSRDSAQQIRRPVIFAVDVAKVVFTGRMKTESVKGGASPIEKCRAQLAFLDVNGERIGDWPKTTDRDGTTDWAEFQQELDCPTNTRVIEVWLGLYNSTGTAWFDDVQVKAYDTKGQEIQSIPTPNEVHTNTNDWIKFNSETEDKSRPLVIDFSSFIPAPAGQFGFNVVKDGHFAFENGQRARFWGTGYIKDWNPPKEQSPAIAEAFARGGINLVRLHGMDALDDAKTIFDKTSPKTDRLDPAKLDRLDFLIAEFKKRGVYVDLNLLTKRKYTTADGIRDVDRLPQGGKAASMFDPTMIQLQKDYDRLILTHVNPYTGLAYKDDPVIAMLEIVNETSMNDLNLPESYENDMNDLFTKWCAAQKIDRPKENVKFLIKKKDDAAERFIESTEKAYFDEQYAYLKNELGVKVPISGTQTDGTIGERRAQFGMDMFDRHAYWDHPTGGWDPMAIFSNKPMVKIASKWNVMDYMFGQRVMGKPFIASEWNFAWPNDYITEGPLIIGSYAAFNDWDSAMIFGTAGLTWSPAMSDTFGHENKPHVMMPLMAMGVAFYRGDVTPGPITAINANSMPAGTSLIRQFSRQELLTRQCVLTDNDEKATRPATKPSADLPPEYRTADGQIDWTTAGQFVLDTPRTQAVLGFTEGKTVVTKDVTITMQNPFAQVIVTSLSNDPIANAPRLLITATARAENTGEQFRVFRRGISKLGSGPILMEPVRAKIELRHNGTTKPVLYAVDAYGRRTERRIDVNASANGAWTFDLGDQPAGWFELSFEDQK